MLDLKKWMAKVTRQTEFKTLLWTNPNPASAFAAQDITWDSGNYDAYEIVYTGYKDQPNIKKTERLDEAQSILTFITGSVGQIGGSLYVFKRNIWKATKGVGFGDVYSSASGGAWSRYTNNTGIIPYKIYGIKYLGGYCLRLALSTCSAIGRWWEHGRCKSTAHKISQMRLCLWEKRQLDIQKICRWYIRGMALFGYWINRLFDTAWKQWNLLLGRCASDISIYRDKTDQRVFCSMLSGRRLSDEYYNQQTDNIRSTHEVSTIRRSGSSNRRVVETTYSRDLGVTLHRGVLAW